MHFEFLIIMFATDFHEVDGSSFPFAIGMARNSLFIFHLISEGLFPSNVTGKVCLISLFFYFFFFLMILVFYCLFKILIYLVKGEKLWDYPRI